MISYINNGGCGFLHTALYWVGWSHRVHAEVVKLYLSLGMRIKEILKSWLFLCNYCMLTFNNICSLPLPFLFLLLLSLSLSPFVFTHMHALKLLKLVDCNHKDYRKTKFDPKFKAIFNLNPSHVALCVQYWKDGNRAAMGTSMRLHTPMAS